MRARRRRRLDVIVETTPLKVKPTKTSKSKKEKQ
jgi:hypothetical protein